MDAPVDPESVAESVLLTRPGTPGDTIRKVARLREADSIVLLEGTVSRARTIGGEEVLIEDYDQAVELCQTEDLDSLVTGLEDLADRL
ncbi:hypothetical protein RH831_04440 [Halodesulfurarchaeum sp. HSR-GB]|uniref:hypothetical protein n=1 Tax=Halodesulfurarchaeum sp. HSR-GB TaxID=3074077 RepID=UPI002862B901|nr:hypothetical protein [Halodesulfurarchaeum sp. HSR-GB]MDR5656428.1 hypothetical protein [Halodesulfurarchaeum sp. HSR-GB]